MQKNVIIQDYHTGAVRLLAASLGLLAVTSVLAGCAGKRSMSVSGAETQMLFRQDTAAEISSAEVPEADAAAGVSPLNVPGAETATEAPRADAMGAALTEDACFAMAVHVCGAVETEGVYELPAGARVIDAVRAAGGFRDDADTAYVNQAAYVTDGMRLRIPALTETEPDAQGTLPEVMSDALAPDAISVPQQDTVTVRLPDADGKGLVNINTATAAELCTLNGIGEARAAEIIRYRETHGAFVRIEDLMKVTGIKEKLFEKIRDAITV